MDALFWNGNVVQENRPNLKGLIFKLHKQNEITGFKICILTIYKLELENRIITLLKLLFIFMMRNEEVLQDLHF